MADDNIQSKPRLPLPDETNEVADPKRKSARRAGSDLWPDASGGRVSAQETAYTLIQQRYAQNKRRPGRPIFAVRVGLMKRQQMEAGTARPSGSD